MVIPREGSPSLMMIKWYGWKNGLHISRKSRLRMVGITMSCGEQAGRGPCNERRALCALRCPNSASRSLLSSMSQLQP
jgi:hypothetical protein